MSVPNAANLGIEADPRLEQDDQPDPVEPQYYDLNKPVSFKHYLELAKQQRQTEHQDVVVANAASESEVPLIRRRPKVDDLNLSPHDRELVNARRALRTASWWVVFYLITTDVFGPYTAPYAFSTVGYVPGVLLFFIMGVAACYTGLLLWYLYLHLDSDVFPIKSYGDLTERIFGRPFKHVVTVLQSIQLIVNVGTLCLGLGLALSEIDRGTLCFVIGILIFALLGMLIGQIRTLKSYGWLANSAVWINLTIILISMIIISRSGPNYEAAKRTYGVEPGPVVVKAFADGPLATRVNGLMNMVFSYGGAMIFPEMLSEMRRPWDFWKSMVCAQLLIFSFYMTYGLVVYTHQGQFTLPIAFQGISLYAWQTVCNVLSIASIMIAAGLYGNIGIKVAYYNIVEGWLQGPPLLSRPGRFIWSGMVVLYWSIAFLIGAAIPQIETIAGLVAAVCIMQFSYTFPPLFIIGFLVRRDGLFGGGLKLNVFKAANLVFFCCAAAVAGVGIYGSGANVGLAFENGVTTSFGCESPVS